ncbi:MAG: hypothetical protein ACD_46C00012G0001, partial [uncultured bacterium]
FLISKEAMLAVAANIKNKIDQELEHGRGYYLGFKIEQKDISIIKAFIKKQWLDHIKKYLLPSWERFDEIGLERY